MAAGRTSRVVFHFLLLKELAMSIAALPRKKLDFVVHEPTVIHCYSLFDKFFPACDLLDYTEGMYHGDPSTPYEVAQRNQIRYVLDEVQCTAGMRILEVGCGNGTLLDEVRRRGAKGVGVTISPEQVALCRRRGLDVRLIDYKLLGAEFTHQFDAVVANGPIEHFVQPREAAQGLTDDIYCHMFETFRRAIDPASPVRRFTNTTIHFARVPQPEALMASPWSYPRGSDDWHWAWLARSFGGFYPEFGQFEYCAQGSFKLLHTMDGTEDYCLTSEEWLRRIRRILPTRLGLKILRSCIPLALRHPRQVFEMLVCMLGTESWNWQFRGDNPPTRLLRQTWECEM
jgi:cyclopropane fatty-acyl-phospholipid synthase-like methyltransferase